MTLLTGVLLGIGVVVVIAVMVVVHVFVRRQDQMALAQLEGRHKGLQEENMTLINDEMAWRLKEEWYKTIFDSTRDMVFVFGVTEEGLPGKFLEVNNIACVRLQRTHEELLNMTPMDIEVSDRPAAMGYSRSDMATMSSSEVQERQHKMESRPMRALVEKIIGQKELVFTRIYESREGHEVPVEVSAMAFSMSGKPMIMYTAHDITGRKEAERALSESEKRFRNFFAHSPIGVAIYDADKNLVDVNLACLRIFGIPDREQFEKYDMFKNAFLPRKARTDLDKGDTVRYEAEIDFDMVREQSMFISSRSGDGFLDIMINNLGSDSEFHPLGWIAQVQDGTDRRKAEMSLRESEVKLRQADKMEAIGSMAGGIAHDFNNILTPILGYTEMTLRTCSEEDVTHTFLSEILKASHRAKDLVNQILTFSRQREKDGQPIRMTPIVKEVIALISGSVPDNIKISRILKAERDIVQADPTQMHQVLMNLCTNAMHATKDKEEGSIEVRMMDLVNAGGPRTEFPELEPGRYLRISVKDNGYGMTKSTAERIFEPFFTTKKSGEGTGMGLAVAHSIIIGFKGAIKVESKVGEGTVFHVALPALEEQEMKEISASSDKLPTGNECILLVDDDATIIEMGERMLATLGYRPVTAPLGPDALEMFKENPGRFDLVMADQVMPGMLGHELCREIRAIRPEIPFILCTGFSESFSDIRIEDEGINELLMKPIIMGDLAEAIRKVLDEGSGGEEE
jgi:PAS domain S-box-containing protein